MIDTLKLWIKDYKIERENTLAIQPPTITNGIQKEPYTLYKDSNYLMEGTKAYYNDDVYHIDLEVKKWNPNPQLSIQFSASKVLNGSNYHLLDSRETLINSLQDTERHLKDIGIRTNINGANNSRLDLTKNAYTKYPFLVYAPIYSGFNMTRSYKQDFGTTFLYKNKQKQFAIYDKLKEMEHRKDSTAGLPTTIRNEIRLMNAKKIKTVTGFKTAGDLIDGFNELPIIYNSIIQKDILRHYKPPSDIDIISNDYLENIIANSMTAKGISLPTMKGLFYIYYIQQEGTKQRILEIAKEQAPNRMVLSRLKTDLNKLEMELLRCNLLKTESKVKTSELLEEYVGLLLKTA